MLDNYNSHHLYEFEHYYKKNNIIILYIPLHSFYLFQPFNIGYFNILKRSYDKKIKNFIQSHINYITKPDFFACFYTTFFTIFDEKNI